MAIWELLKATFNDWSEDEAPRLGAALAYYAMFSMAPLLVIIIAVVGFFYRGNSAAEIQQQIGAQVGPQAAGVLSRAIDSSNDLQAGIVAAAISLGALFMGATGVFVELRASMNKIFEVQPRAAGGIAGFVKERATAFAMVLCIAFLLLVSMLASVALSAMMSYFEGVLPGVDYVWRLADLAVSVVVITLLFALLFRYVPDARNPWKDVWVGAFVTALLFIIGKYLIGFYLSRAAVGSTFGAAGSLMVLLAWVYYSSQIVFLGAEFTQAYSNRFGTRAQQAASRERPAA